MPDGTGKEYKDTKGERKSDAILPVDVDSDCLGVDSDCLDVDNDCVDVACDCVDVACLA